MSIPRILLLSLSSAAFMTGVLPANADEVGNFYKGKTVTMFVGFSPGGNYDIGARLVSKFMSKYLPGQPNFVVKNKPGAAGLILASELYHGIHPNDGTVMGTFDRNAPLKEVLGEAKGKFKTAELTWIGSTSRESAVCAVWHNTGLTPKNFLESKVIVGAIPNSGTALYPTLLHNVLGTDFKMVTGYSGARQISMALERGEVQGRCGWSWSSVSTEHNWLKDKKVIVTLVLGHERIAEVPDVPTVFEHAKNDYQKRVLDYILSSQEMGRPIAGPPKIPAERVAALRASFDKSMKDPELLKQAERQQYWIDPTSGAQLEKIVLNMFQAPQNIRDAAIKAITTPIK